MTDFVVLPASNPNTGAAPFEPPPRAHLPVQLRMSDAASKASISGARR